MYADLSALRPGLVWDSKTNMSWNLKTILLLLERGGALRVISQSPPEIDQTTGETDGEFKLRSDEVMEKH